MGKLETVADFILGGSKITSDGDYSLEIKRHLFLGRKVMTTGEYQADEQAGVVGLRWLVSGR